MLSKFTQFLPKPPLTPDQVALLKTDSIVSPEATAAGLTFEGLGIKPVTAEAEVASYLWRFRKSGQFENLPA